MDNFKSVVVFCTEGKEKQFLHNEIRKAIPQSIFRTVYNNSMLAEKQKWGKPDLIILGTSVSKYKHSELQTTLSSCEQNIPVVLLVKPENRGYSPDILGTGNQSVTILALDKIAELGSFSGHGDVGDNRPSTLATN